MVEKYLYLYYKFRNNYEKSYIFCNYASFFFLYLHVSVIRLPEGTDPENDNYGVIRKNENSFPVWGDFKTENQNIWINMINPFNYNDPNTWKGCYK